MRKGGEQLSFDGMGLDALVEHSVALLREHEPSEGYYGCFSGGKDSVAIKALARMAGVRVVWHYNVTTIDPPELIYFMRRHHRDVKWVRSLHGNFFKRMEIKGFPTRKGPWCCDEYKKSRNPRGATLILGIRAEESSRRAKLWRHVTRHTKTGTDAILPILSWPAEELWQFIRCEGLPYCSLYDEGFHRLGCIGCPKARRKGKLKEFARWPKFERRWKLSFKCIWERRAGTINRDGREWFGVARFRDWEAMWEWWLSDDSLPPTDDFPLFNEET